MEKCNIENCNEEEDEEEGEDEGEEEAEKEETWQELMGNDLLLQVRSFVHSYVVCCFGAEHECMYVFYSKCLIPFFVAFYHRHTIHWIHVEYTREYIR